jgi:hypothetical protein
MRLNRRELVLAGALAPFAVRAEMTDAGIHTGKKLLVLDFEIVDTSNEPGDQRADHARRLIAARTAIEDGLRAHGTYIVLDRKPIETEIAGILQKTHLRTCNGCERELAAKVGADLVMTGVVNKVSLLILSMGVTISRVSSDEPLFHQGFDFRGDNDRSYEKTGKYIADRLARDPVV